MDNLSGDGIIFIGFISFILWFWILYWVVKYALSETIDKTLKQQNINLKLTNRLLIKQLIKQGYTKKELMELYNQDTNQFWASIEEPK